MIWALIEILLPMLTTFVFGMLVGWVVWGRRQIVKNQHLESRISRLSAELSTNKIDLADAQKIAVRVSQLEAELDAISTSQAPIESPSSMTGENNNGTESHRAGAEIELLKLRIAEMTPLVEQSKAHQSQVAVLQARLQQSESKVRQIEQSEQRIEQLDSQLQTRLADELEQARQQIQELEQRVNQSAEKAVQLVRVRSRVATLETELGMATSRAEDADKLQHRVNELESMLKGTEVKKANERLVELEAQLRIANSRVADQQSQIDRLHCADSVPEGESGVSRITAIDDNSSESKADQKADRKPDQRANVSNTVNPLFDRASLTGHQTAGATNNSVSADKVTTPPPDTIVKTKDTQDIETQETDKRTATHQTARVVAPEWQAGVTRLGTPAARHKDDLKVIRGIGPVLERTLNETEIQTWDQLAALTHDEIELIEQSIDFPGRMTREHWIEQAAELVDLYPDLDNRPSGRKLLPKKS